MINVSNRELQMSGTLTIGGGFNSQQGILPVPSNMSTSLNTLLQQYLDGVSSSVVGGFLSFENYDVETGADFKSTVTGAGLEVFTNTDSVGSISSSSLSGSYSVSAAATSVVVQAPGNTTLSGNGQTSTAIFGAASNVNYTDTNGGTPSAADSIYAAGGSDSITTFSTTNAGASYVISTAGNDTVNLKNQGTDTVVAGGTAPTTVFISQADATVSATGSAPVGVQFSQGAGGNLDFINSGTTAATIFSGNYAGGAAPNSVTAFGGAGGGYYVGGRAGNNSLVGGTGVVTLQGAGAGDFLEAQSGAAQNVFFAGTGNETLIASSTTASNFFQLGLNYTGSSGAIVANASVSTDGSGAQSFILGSSSSTTLTGSLAAGATNTYDFVRDSQTQANGGTSYTITDFAANSSLYITDSTLAAGSVGVTTIGTPLSGSGAEIVLSDNTVINISNVGASQLHATSLSGGVWTVTLK